MQRGALCRSRRELSHEYVLAHFGFDTAENEPSKVCPLSVYRLILLQILQVEQGVPTTWVYKFEYKDHLDYAASLAKGLGHP